MKDEIIDENNKIWCINDKGGIEWSHITGGHILSELKVIDFQGKDFLKKFWRGDKKNEKRVLFRKILRPEGWYYHL